MSLSEIVLSNSLFYKLYRGSLFSSKSQKEIVDTYIRPIHTDKILDIGCGPADILEYLPGSVDYLGFDTSEKYIKFAKKRFKARGQFFCQNVAGNVLVKPSAFDIVIAFGVLHHLNDNEAIQLFKVSHSALKPGGRLITFDGCYVDGQSILSRYIISKDRGEYVRNEQGYINLALSVFKKVNSNIRHDLLRAPYTHSLLECVK